jgi:hypothetical protein
VTYCDSQGQKHTVQAKYLASADGKTGFTRRRYLEPKGIVLEPTTSKYEETWVAMNWKITLPTPESHPDFPLWRKGYNSEQVYDLFFSQSTSAFLCKPDRPVVCGRFGLNEDRLWQLEYVILDSEDALEMSSPDGMKQIVYPYVTHPGSRYGPNESIQFPEDCIVMFCAVVHFVFLPAVAASGVLAEP